MGTLAGRVVGLALAGLAAGAMAQQADSGSMVQQADSGLGGPMVIQLDAVPAPAARPWLRSEPVAGGPAAQAYRPPRLSLGTNLWADEHTRVDLRLRGGGRVTLQLRHRF